MSRMDSDLFLSDHPLASSASSVPAPRPPSRRPPPSSLLPGRPTPPLLTLSAEPPPAPVHGLALVRGLELGCCHSPLYPPPPPPAPLPRPPPPLPSTGTNLAASSRPSARCNTPTMKETDTRARGEARKRRRRRHNTRTCVSEAAEPGEGFPCGGIGVPRPPTRRFSPELPLEEGGLVPQMFPSSTPPFSTWKPRRVCGGTSPPFGARGARSLIVGRVARMADVGSRPLSPPRFRLVW